MVREAGPLTLARAELGRFSKLHAMSSQHLLPNRAQTQLWRLDQFGDEIVWRARDWRAGDRVLDAGCGYSEMLTQLQDKYSVEAWGVDDFGGGDAHWSRGQDVRDFLLRSRMRYVKTGSKVRYVTELLGDSERSSLPQNSFNCVYSKLGVHFTPGPHGALWRHMEMLLSDEPGSDLLVIAGCGDPTQRDPYRGLDRLHEINDIEEDILARWRRGRRCSPAFWEGLSARENLLGLSPFIYSAYVMDVLGVQGVLSDELRALRFCLDPDALIDPWHVPARRACFARDPDALENVNFGRTFALVLGFKRAALH